MRALFILCLLACSTLCAGIDEHAKVCVVMPCDTTRKAIVHKLQAEGFTNVVAEPCYDSKQIRTLFEREKPEYVIVDGTDEADMSRTLLIDTQTLHEAYRQGVKKCLLLSSFAIYPVGQKSPHKEDELTSLKVEEQKDPYAIAKLAALQLCHEYNDQKEPRFITCPHPFLFDAKTPLEQKLHNPVTEVLGRIAQAKQITREFVLISNDGKAKYELLHISDLASAVVFLLRHEVEYEIMNIGTGRETSMHQIANFLYKGSGHKGELIFDATEFDVVPRQVLNSNRIQSMGWSPVTDTAAALKTPK
ncbi:MAG: NAD-dependent epimerase/dehydratase family protein [Verrucomicrobia bacterium]|nr:NAD-dependent epimerase/dehydratase family protein [Verrucomicrobiota bacterium]